jgi:hypothetical protein
MSFIRQQHFIKGLNEDLQSILSLHECSSLQDVIDKAIGLESKLQKIVSKKRKKEFPGEANNISHLHHMSQAQYFPEDHYEDAYLEYPHGVKVPVIYETPQIVETLGKVKLVSIAKLVDTLSAGARRNV